MKPDAAPARMGRAVAVGCSATGLALAAHAAGGGGFEPVSAALLCAALVAAGYRFAGAQRRLVAISAFVVSAQVGAHVLLAADHGGHTAPDGRMLAAHLLAALALAGFLRFAERQLFEAAIRRYVRWRMALAGAVVPVPGWQPPLMPVADGWSVVTWEQGLCQGRGPPGRAFAAV